MSRRILIIDDNAAIHDDFKKVLAPRDNSEQDLDRRGADLFGANAGAAAPAPARTSFAIDVALQGREGFEMASVALRSGKPYALAFVDVRMPPGWDGIETIEHLWQVDPDLQVVICTAYSDFSWEEIRRRLGVSDGLLLLKKPFDSAEVNQLAHALTRKWALHVAARRRTEELEELVQKRTALFEEANARLAQEHALRQRMEQDLRLSQKLESIGQLAAGIAHEINTPTQYVGDNVRFLSAASAELFTLNSKLRDACSVAADADAHRARMEDVARFEADIDLAHLEVGVPAAFASAIHGLERIATIVHATADFGHVDKGEKAAVDINRAIEAVLEIARSEYRYVADVEVALGVLPPVRCFGGAMSQVLLNIIVNAAHAVRAVAEVSGKNGVIRVRSEVSGDDVVVTIEDTGGGIPDPIKERVFDPFFTTKELGKGTGQGLAIARAIVVEKHGGSLQFTSAPAGTTFFIRIPISGEKTHAHAVAS